MSAAPWVSVGHGLRAVLQWGHSECLPSPGCALLLGLGRPTAHTWDSEAVVALERSPVWVVGNWDSRVCSQLPQHSRGRH